MGRLHIKADQRGIVSIMVTMSLIVVASLIVLAFAQIARREQRLSLDNQLSTQAFYAAESGINVARAQVASAITASGTVPSDDDCNNNDLPNDNAEIDAATLPGVKYTCVLVDSAPSTLQATIGRTAKALLLRPDSGGALGTVKVRWMVADGGGAGSLTDCPDAAANGLMPKANWECPYDVLRFDLTNASNVTRNALLANTRSGYIVPGTGGAPISNGGGSGIKAEAACEPFNAATPESSYCEATFTGLGAGDHYIRLSTVYTDNVTVQITRSSGGGFSGAQVQIDATGKAQDVLRRVRASISLTPNNTLGETAAITSGETICKLGVVSEDGTGYADNCHDSTLVTITPPAVCTQTHDIVLVLDISSSMDTQWETMTRFNKMIEVAHEFVDETGISASGNRVGIVSFWNNSKIDLTFSSNKTAIHNAINALPKDKNGTNYTAGLTDGAEVLANNWRGGTTKRVLVFLSDGRPNQGETEASQLIARAQNIRNNYDTLFYAVGIIDSGVSTLMRDMASPDAGGRRHYTTATTETDFRTFFRDIRSQISCSDV